MSLPNTLKQKVVKFLLGNDALFSQQLHENRQCFCVVMGLKGLIIAQGVKHPALDLRAFFLVRLVAKDHFFVRHAVSFIRVRR